MVLIFEPSFFALVVKVMIPLPSPPWTGLGRRLESATRKAIYDFLLLEGVPRLGGAKLLSQGIPTTNNPTLNMAQKVFKVLTATSAAPKEAPKAAEEETPEEAPKSYGSLEELIGIEGAPKPVPPPSP